MGTTVMVVERERAIMGAESQSGGQMGVCPWQFCVTFHSALTGALCACGPRHVLPMVECLGLWSGSTLVFGSVDTSGFDQNMWSACVSL
jgi:hypothetical protein